MFQVISRNAKQRFVAQKPALDDRAGNRRQHHRAQNAGGPAADNFFDDEQHGGDGSVERRGQPGGSAHRRDQPQLLARQLQAPPQRRCDAGADLQRGIFGAKRLSAADGQRARNEFSDDRRHRNVAVVNVECGFGLIDAAAASAREKSDHQNGDHQPGQHGSQENPRHRRHQPASQQMQLQVLNRHAEADHRQSRSNADQHRQQQEKLLFPQTEALRRQHGAQAAPVLTPGGRRHCRLDAAGIFRFADHYFGRAHFTVPPSCCASVSSARSVNSDVGQSGAVSRSTSNAYCIVGSSASGFLRSAASVALVCIRTPAV